jgi:hypothetical protein
MIVMKKQIQSRDEKALEEVGSVIGRLSIAHQQAILKRFFEVEWWSHVDVSKSECSVCARPISQGQSH